MSEAAENAAARAIDRARAWTWAERAAKARDGWRLEALRHHLERAEEQPGSMPDPALPDRGHKGARIAYAIGGIVGLFVLAAWLLSVRGARLVPKNSKRVVALHGEVSTRTRHVLASLATAAPPVDAIVLLGRLRHGPRQIEELWARAGYGPLPLLVVPGGFRAALSAVRDLPGLWGEGWRTARSGLGGLGWRDWAGICFRAWHGAVMARWWAEQSVSERSEVVFGITGTIDTVLFERKIKEKGGRSVHAVHGQSVGPVFLGFSDIALFRSRHDAIQMESCSGYGRCDVQVAPRAMARRGASGIVLLSNLAHPMNPDFRRFGPVAELSALKAVANAAQRLGRIGQPLLWKPHPVIASLPENQAAELRAQASALGFSELPASTPAAEAAANAFWVVATPSTVALDLLQSGLLSVTVDPRGTLLDTAVSALPNAPSAGEGIAEALLALADATTYGAKFEAAWAAIGPASPLDLTQPFD